MEFSQSIWSGLAGLDKFEQEKRNLIAEVAVEALGTTESSNVIPEERLGLVALTNQELLEMKRVYNATCSLIVEMLSVDRYNYRTKLFQSLGLNRDLEEDSALKEYLEKICEFVDKDGQKIVDESFGSLNKVENLANVIDVEWRLDYRIRSSSGGVLHEPLYYVRLILDGTQPDVCFTCNLQQMQDLVTSLADAKKQVDRLRI